MTLHTVLIQLRPAGPDRPVRLTGPELQRSGATQSGDLGQDQNLWNLLNCGDLDAVRLKLSMSSLLAVFFCCVWTFCPLTDASPTVSAAPDLSQESSGCLSCSLTQVTKNSSSVGGQSEMVEAVKRHILNMLHLSARPNVTQPVPRSALLNAIKKLHVGRVAEDGSVEILEDEEGPGASPPPEPASEIITFGEPGEPRPF